MRTSEAEGQSVEKMSHFIAVETESQREVTTHTIKVERGFLHDSTTCFPGPTCYRSTEETTASKGTRGGEGWGSWDQGIAHSHAVVGLGDIVECRDSGFVLGFHTEVPVVGHKLQDSSHWGNSRT